MQKRRVNVRVRVNLGVYSSESVDPETDSPRSVGSRNVNPRTDGPGRRIAKGKGPGSDGPGSIAIPLLQINNV